MKRIDVDFNTMNQDLESRDRRVLVGKEIVGLQPRTGLRVLIADEELEVEATLEFDREHSVWWARPDWSTRRESSEAAFSVHKVMSTQPR